MKIIKFALLLLVFAGTSIAMDIEIVDISGNIEIEAETYSEMMEACEIESENEELTMCKDVVEMMIVCISTVSDISVEEAKNHKNIKELTGDPSKGELLSQCFFTKALEYFKNNL